MLGRHGLRMGTLTVIFVTALFLFSLCWLGSRPAAAEEDETDQPCPKPYIKTITPRVTASGEAVKIRGNRFGSLPGSVTLSGTAEAVIVSWSQKRIYAAIPEGAASGMVTVHSSCGNTSNQIYLTVTPKESQDGEEPARPEGEDDEEN